MDSAAESLFHNSLFNYTQNTSGCAPILSMKVIYVYSRFARVWIKKKKKVAWNKYIFRKTECAYIIFPLNSINKTFIKLRYDRCNYLKALQTHATQFNLFLCTHIFLWYQLFFFFTQLLLFDMSCVSCFVWAIHFLWFYGFMHNICPLERHLLHKLWVLVNQYRMQTVQISDRGNGRDVQLWSIKKKKKPSWTKEASMLYPQLATLICKCKC